MHAETYDLLELKFKQIPFSKMSIGIILQESLSLMQGMHSDPLPKKQNNL